MQQNALKMLGISRTSLLEKGEGGSGLPKETPQAPTGNNGDRCCYGLSAELSMLHEVPIAPPIVRIGE